MKPKKPKRIYLYKKNPGPNDLYEIDIYKGEIRGRLLSKKEQAKEILKK